ncbi:GNAT family N-acetyltransferase [Saccharomonospora sp. CUA-673]|uniref:GNAT family N-acetyltransferase n=1 Tax=Saccharomonospora sp. CUA-673 TaxID=1904969 RepID=UPI0021017C30|nr:GNAT family protein [Saccharomonospora sp. CUA-673]
MTNHRIDLVGKHVRIREFTPDDLDDVHRIVGDERVTAHLSFDARTRDEASAMLNGILERAQVEPRSEYYLAITPKGESPSGGVVGFARLGFAGVQAAKLGYAIAADHQGRGYATDTVRAMLELAFGALQRHRVSAAIGPENAASHAVVQRVGFTREGILRDHVFTNGAWRDSVLYSILADEWTTHQA